MIADLPALPVGAVDHYTLDLHAQPYPAATRYAVISVEAVRGGIVSLQNRPVTVKRVPPQTAPTGLTANYSAALSAPTGLTANYSSALSAPTGLTAQYSTTPLAPTSLFAQYMTLPPAPTGLHVVSYTK